MKKLAIISTIVLGFAATSCDSYLDINQDPNSPAESNMTTDILLPGAEMNLAGSYGDFLRITGGYYAQHFAQTFGTSNYLDYSQFTMSATRSSGTYTQLSSRALKNLETTRSISKDKEWGTYLAATTLRAFIYQTFVDCYGEIPFTEAFTSGITSPRYDNGDFIYASILTELDDALAQVQPTDQVATNFLFPGKTAEPWIQFANALKLKIMMREYDAVDVAAKVKDLIDANNFPTADVAYAGCWSNESGAMSPFFAEEFSPAWGSTQENVVANVAIINTMLQKDGSGDVVYSDPRLPAFFEKNGSGAYTGGISGTNFSTSDTYKSDYWCRPVATYDMPVYLITLAETEFFIAEYYARQNDATQAQAHYDAAITASCASAGVGSGAATVIAQFPYNQANWKQTIGVSKWVALAGTNNFEAWCEVRRMDYPTFGTVSGSQMYDLKTDASYKPELLKPGTLYTPIQVDNKVGDNTLLNRWNYPESSSARNGSAPEFPGNATKIFWDK